jgi:hypothetical protein
MKEALKLALEALEDLMYWDNGKPEYDEAREAITTIKEALAQPEQEPDDVNADALEMVELELPDEDEAVAWADCGVINWIAGKQFKHASYLYTTPPQRTWVGLTDIQYSILAEQYTGADGLDCVDYGRAIEAKLKEKNT